ncbi:hypothetical protein Cgig2_010278 [Carnegiea gigantea]|uniref:NADH:quinone oxidoreductase/Mrp antiporter transmembrane domain-containing protein n=1 Tax=Carnegiea gigantea TaxID=171969 RepID=A0A9Q1JRF6_9CARY|nr:hypothetical protein Cgig2_010278 [Carnegiea gigantea]
MTIDASAIVSALWQTRVKYVVDLGALAKTNPISAITFSITIFSNAGIPPLADFYSKFYLFFTALGCGAYFIAPVGVVTSVTVATRLVLHATKDRVESDTSTIYSIFSYESTTITRDEIWFGELKLAFGVIGLLITVHDRILRCSPLVVRTMRAGPQFINIKGCLAIINRRFKIPHLIEGGKRIDISLWERTVKSIQTNRPMKNKKRAKRMQNRHRKKKCGREAVKLIPFYPLGVDPFTLFYFIRLVKRMFFDAPRTWILYEPMDHDKSSLLAMTSSFVTSSFLHPSPLLSVTHQMALSLYP